MIKSDINLMPQKQKLPLSVTLGIVIGVVLLAVLLTAGILLPSLLLDQKRTRLDSIQHELESYGNIQSEYVQKFAELNTMQEQQKNYLAFENTDRQTLEIMNLITAAIPHTVTILEEVFSDDNVSLRGYATDDIEIAKFEVALRKTAIFSSIQLGTIEGPEKHRMFDFILTYIQAEDQADGGVGK